MKAEATAPALDHTMGWLEFVSGMTGALAWPIAFVVAVLVFRHQIRTLFSRLNQIGFGDAKATFSKELDQAEEKIESLPEPSGPQLPAPSYSPHDKLWMSKFNSLLSISPNAAIIETFSSIQRLLHRLVRNRKVELPRNAKNPKAIANVLAEQGLIPLSALNIIYLMQEMRNRAAHGEDATATDALRFRDLANQIGRVLFSAGVPPEERPKRRKLASA